MRKNNFVFGLFIAAVAMFWGCGGDSDSSSGERIVAIIEDPTNAFCRETYGVDADSGWSGRVLAGSYLEKMVCDKVSERMNLMLSFYARCVSASYSKSNNRFDIEVITERGDHHLWADITGCKYRLGVEDDYQFNYFVANSPEWTFDECYCKMEDSVAYYRNVDLNASEEESSSSIQSSSSSQSAKSSSSSNGDTADTKSSSSSKTESSSSESVLVTDEFVKIGTQEWMTRNLDVAVEGSRCYDDEESNCEKYGRIYTWAQAMAIDKKYDREELGILITPYRGICPEGSHLPTDEEWALLEKYIDQHPEYKAYFINQIGGAYDWKAFYRDEDVETVFWTSTEYDVTGSDNSFEYAWIWAYRKNGSIARSNPHKYMGAYVRCVKGDGLVMSQSSSSVTESSSSVESSEESSSSVESSSSEDIVDDTWMSYEYPDLGRVEIGTQVWTTKNLEVPMKNSRCYADDEANCEKYGRLYTWATAMAVSTKYDREELGKIEHPYRGICPEGTHIPSQEEWVDLYDYVMANPEAKSNFTNQLGGEYEYYGSYEKVGVQALFWSSTEYDVTGSSHEFEFAWLWAYRKDASIARDNAHKYTAAYVRCIYNN